MARYSILKFLREQLGMKLPLTTADLAGRVIVVVGPTSGLGLEATRHLAAMKPERIILGCRSVDRGAAAVKDITASTGYTAMEVWQVDLESFASVSAFADRFAKEGGGTLDLLLPNAGVYTTEFTPTADKYERSLQINHLSIALLAFRFLPYLAKSSVVAPGPRIVLSASEMHYQVPRLVEADRENIIHALNDPSTAKMDQRYHESKLINVFFTRAFAQHLKRDTVAIDCINPGFCHSGLTREVTGLRKYAMTAFKTLVARTPEMGSRAIVAGALRFSNAEVHGKYMNACRVEEESDYAIGAEGGKVQQRLWDETIAILKGVDPHIGEIVDGYFGHA